MFVHIIVYARNQVKIYNKILPENGGDLYPGHRNRNLLLTKLCTYAFFSITDIQYALCSYTLVNKFVGLSQNCKWIQLQQDLMRLIIK